MFKIKWCFILLCSLFLLNACRKKDARNEFYVDALLTSEETNYKTTKIIKGDFSKQAKLAAEVYYPITKQLTFKSPGSNVVFVEYLVSMFDKVEKGTPLANFIIEYDAVALEEKELKLKRLTESYEQELIKRKDKITQKELETNNQINEYEKEIKEYELEKLKLEYDSYRLLQEDMIQREESDLGEYKSSLSNTQLLAPMDGMISELMFIKEGESVHSTDILISMISPDEVWFKVNDKSGSLRYNMDVTIVLDSDKKETTELRGKVISHQSLIGESLPSNTENVIIDVIDEDMDLSIAKSATVYADTMLLENVLLVDSGAVLYEGDKPFVSILEDGLIRKRFFASGDNNANYYWILDGLEEGQIVILNR